MGDRVTEQINTISPLDESYFLSFTWICHFSSFKLFFYHRQQGAVP